MTHAKIVCATPYTSLLDLQFEVRYTAANERGLREETCMAAKLEVFFSYAHADEEWRDKLEKHLGGLKRQRRILTWHDRKILPGAEWAPEIGAHLSSADIILLLISSDFISSEYCWSVELKQAIKRHEAGNARVIPIIVRPVNWKKTPFARLQALPKDGKPVSTWPDIDEALLNVAEGVQNAVEDLRPETKSLSMHRLVQAVLKDGMDQ